MTYPTLATATATTIPELLEARAAATPDRHALRFEGAHLTFEELLDDARALADQLHQFGVAAGDHVAVMLPNGLDFPRAWLALTLLDAVAVPINVRYRKRDLAYIVLHSDTSVAIVGPEQRASIEAVLDQCPSVRLVCTMTEGKLAKTVRAGQPSTTEERRKTTAAPGTTTLQYTSGTTGMPKGCMLGHSYWLRIARSFQDHLRLGPDDVVLTAQPQSYMDPSWNLVLTLLAGVPLVVLPWFSPSRFWAQVRESGATFFYCVGTMPMYLLRQPQHASDQDHSVRMVYCSGIPPALHEEFEERWGVPWRETYGTTELGVVLLTPPNFSEAVGSGSMGAPLAGRDIRVINAAGGDVPPDTPGELLVRGEDTMFGYYDDPVATREWRSGEWAHTGDIVRCTDRNTTVLVGRMKDMIRRGGENIAASEVEGVLLEHPAVAAVACIPVPDTERGEEVKAYVQLTDEGAAAGTTPEVLYRHVLERLAPFKAPRYIELLTTLPRTQSEKIAKAALQESRSDHRGGSWDSSALESEKEQ